MSNGTIGAIETFLRINKDAIQSVKGKSSNLPTLSSSELLT
jgi:hypothetical protein